MLQGINLFCGKYISFLIRDYTRLILYVEKVYFGIHETPASKRRSKCGFLLKVSEFWKVFSRAWKFFPLAEITFDREVYEGERNSFSEM